MKNILAAFGLLVVVSACDTNIPKGDTSTQEYEEYDKVLKGNTRYFGEIAARSQICGLKRVDKFQEAFFQSVKKKRTISPATEQKMREDFAHISVIYKLFIDTEDKRKAFCRTNKVNQASIDRTIEQGFGGEI